MMLAQPKTGKFIMNLLPDKNLILFTSALKTNFGKIDFETRCKETIEALESVRKHFPNDVILFTDGSPFPIENEPILQDVAKYVNAIVCWNQDGDLQNLAKDGQKSAMELLMVFKMLVALRSNPELMKLTHEIKRIWKYSSRTTLNDSFNPKEHDHFGKYVFKKRIESWMSEERKKNITDNLLITRMYSFCPSLITDYLSVLQNSFQDVLKYQIDTEHAHFKNIDKKYLVELDTIQCQGVVAGSGELEKY